MRIDGAKATFTDVMTRDSKKLVFYTHPSPGITVHRELMMTDLPSDNNRQVRYSLHCENGTLTTVLNGQAFTSTNSQDEYLSVDVNMFSSSFHGGSVTMGQFTVLFRFDVV